mgnify:FL=1
MLPSSILDLQRQIAPPEKQSAADYAKQAVRKMQDGTIFGEKDRLDIALDKYLDLCDNFVFSKEIIKAYDVSREDLKQIFIELMSVGMGWLKGHYTPLSTIYFREPLIYYVHSKKTGVDHMEIVYDLLRYWNGDISWEKLAKKINDNKKR